MSPAPKSKSKSTSNKSSKETQPVSKPSQKPSTLTNGSGLGSGSGSASNAYNPLSGTFHTLETSDLLLNPVKFRSIEESEDNSPISPNFDSASNHDSCSGESEDTNKDKSASATSAALNSVPESDKREKIRQKNERKHQRQRERRAQELHEKCSGYLMSRKLELLSQQLVAMGFSQEQATMALIQNEGKVEESVAWLFEGGEESRQPESSALDLNCGVGLKIDITDELARIAEYEIKYNCTKQEVERAIVNCEGDLVKAEEILKTQKQEARPKTPPVPPPVKSEEPVPVQVQTVSANQRPPLGAKVAGSVSMQQQQKKGERDFNYARAQETMKNPVQVSDRPLNLLTQKQQQQLVLEKRWQAGMQNPSLYPPSSSHMPVPVPQVKPEQHYPVPASMMKGNSVNSAAVGVTGQMNPLRDPVVVMQRPQQALNPNNNNPKQNLPSTSLGLGHHHHSNGSIPGLSESKMYNNNRALALGLTHGVQNLGLGRNNGLANGGMTTGTQHYGAQNHVEVPVTSSWVNGSGLASPSSLGLFTGWGPSRSPNGTHNSADWNNGGYNPCDYTSIDWSLDLTLLNTSNGTGGTGTGNGTGLSETWSTMFMGRSGTGIGNPVRKGSTGTGNESRLSDWTSPFSGEDILGASRKFVMSPSCSRGGRGEGILE